jgi:hypothetical protein
MERSKTSYVSNVTGAGIFISLSEAVQGRIRLRDLTTERVIIDPSETMAFVSYEGKMRYENEITAHNWQNFIDEDGEASAVLMKLGDKLGVIINSRDYVDGRVGAIPYIEVIEEPEELEELEE